jgi:hypothetical protein
MITIALARAQNAVLLDQRNNITAALDGYSQCCAILAEVIANETDGDDMARLEHIYDVYSVRMHHLSTMQFDPLPNVMRDMPPLPTQADLEDFEDEEEEEELLLFGETQMADRVRPAETRQPEIRRAESRQSDVRPSRPSVASSRPSLHRSTSSRGSTFSRSGPIRNYMHSGSSSVTRSSSQEVLTSLEQIPRKYADSVTSQRDTMSRDTMSRDQLSRDSAFRDSMSRDPDFGTGLPDMSEEEMDDAAFLERITRGFTSEEEILEDEAARPSTASTASSVSQHQPSKRELFNLSQPSFSTASVTHPQDDLISPRTTIPPPLHPTPPPKPKPDRGKTTNSILQGTTAVLPTASSPPKKNLSVTSLSPQSTPMLKSLSANNAIPNQNEGSAGDSVPTVPGKNKKRPQLIRVVSESTMRTHYGSSRLSHFEVSPVSPSSTVSVVTPGTSTGTGGFLGETSPIAVRSAITHDREGAAPAEIVPEDPYHRPYWIMRAIMASMRNPKGAFVTHKCFIPQGVWTAKNVKVKGSEDKMNCFHTMSMAVKQVLEADNKNVPLLLQVCISTDGANGRK